MQYLTYGKYKDLGGTLDDTAFKRNIDRVCTMIDLRTQSRLETFEEIPELVEIVCADLLDYVSTNTVDKTVVSRSQSGGPVSESESYVIKTPDDYASDLDRILEPLATIKTKNGISLLYRGAMS